MKDPRLKPTINRKGYPPDEQKERTDLQKAWDMADANVVYAPPCPETSMKFTLVYKTVFCFKSSSKDTTGSLLHSSW